MCRFRLHFEMHKFSLVRTSIVRVFDTNERARALTDMARFRETQIHEMTLSTSSSLAMLTKCVACNVRSFWSVRSVRRLNYVCLFRFYCLLNIHSDSFWCYRFWPHIEHCAMCSADSFLCIWNCLITLFIFRTKRHSKQDDEHDYFFVASPCVIKTHTHTFGLHFGVSTRAFATLQTKNSSPRSLKHPTISSLWRIRFAWLCVDCISACCRLRPKHSSHKMRKKAINHCLTNEWNGIVKTNEETNREQNEEGTKKHMKNCRQPRNGQSKTNETRRPKALAFFSRIRVSTIAAQIGVRVEWMKCTFDRVHCIPVRPSLSLSSHCVSLLPFFFSTRLLWFLAVIVKQLECFVFVFICSVAAREIEWLKQISQQFIPLFCEFSAFLSRFFFRFRRSFHCVHFVHILLLWLRSPFLFCPWLESNARPEDASAESFVGWQNTCAPFCQAADQISSTNFTGHERSANFPKNKKKKTVKNVWRVISLGRPFFHSFFISTVDSFIWNLIAHVLRFICSLKITEKSE